MTNTNPTWLEKLIRRVRDKEDEDAIAERKKVVAERKKADACFDRWMWFLTKGMDSRLDTISCRRDHDHIVCRVYDTKNVFDETEELNEIFIDPIVRKKIRDAVLGRFPSITSLSIFGPGECFNYAYVDIHVKPPDS